MPKQISDWKPRFGPREFFQPYLRDLELPRSPGVKTPGYSQPSLRDENIGQLSPGFNHTRLSEQSLCTAKKKLPPDLEAAATRLKAPLTPNP